MLGKSAGGYSSLYVGYNDDFADPTSENPLRQQSTDVNALLLYDTPTAFDRDWIDTNLANCDTTNWNKIMAFYGLPVSILPGQRTLDWTEYYANPEVQAAIIQARIETYVDPTDPPAYISYSEPLYDGLLPSNADCIHSPNYAQVSQPTWTQQ